MLVITHHHVRHRDAPGFLELARQAFAAFSARPGWVRGTVGQSADDQGRWAVVTEWADVGSYRRALSAYDVRMRATPLLHSAADGSTAFEVILLRHGDDVTEFESAHSGGGEVV